LGVRLMRAHEVVVEVATVGSSGGIPPLTPEKARRRKAKLDKAAASLQDLKQTNAVRLAAAQRKAADI
jgi:hypothetical protein